MNRIRVFGIVTLVIACTTFGLWTDLGAQETSSASQPFLKGPARAAAAAKQRGKTSTFFDFIAEGPIDEDSETTLRKNSSLVVVPTDAPSLVTSTDEWIFTWRVVRIEKILRKGLPGICNATLPAGMKLGTDEAVLILLGGAVVVDGVQVTMRSPDTALNLRAGHPVLVVGNHCPNGTLSLADLGSRAVFNVDPSGKVASTGGYDSSLKARVLSLGTVAGFQKYLARLKEAR